jgi:hypothetical protein
MAGETLNIARPSRQLPAVQVEYDTPQGRGARTFTNQQAARSFYFKQHKAGNNPRLRKASDSDVRGAATVAGDSQGATIMTKNNTTQASTTSSNGTTRQKKTNMSPIRWTPSKINLIKTLRGLRAFDEASAKTVEQIVKAAKGKLEEKNVKHQVNPIYDLTAQEMIASTRHEGERFSRFYLPKPGQTVVMTPYVAGKPATTAKV